MKKYLIEKLKALFVGRSLIRYEVMSLMAHVDYQEEKLKQAQDEVGIFKTMTYNGYGLTKLQKGD